MLFLEVEIFESEANVTRNYLSHISDKKSSILSVELQIFFLIAEKIKIQNTIIVPTIC